MSIETKPQKGQYYFTFDEQGNVSLPKRPLGQPTVVETIRERFFETRMDIRWAQVPEPDKVWGEPNSFKDAEFLERVLLKDFLKKGFAQIVSEETGVPLSVWFGIRSERRPIRPFDKWDVLVMGVPSDTYDTCTQSCWSHGTKKFATIFGNGVEIALVSGHGDDARYVRIAYDKKGEFEMEGAEKELSGALSDDETYNQNLFRESLRATMNNPLTKEQEAQRLGRIV